MKQNLPAASRSALGEEDAQYLAEVMRALASPLRLRILSCLLEGPATVSELCERLGSAQAAVSNHLRLLRHLNLVVGVRHGRNVCYRLFDEHVNDLLNQAIGHASHLPDRSSE
ncbi:ArsR/SmtB family transcription factor [Rarobacter incanus]|nr:metalloregulator ArsR/SmtB family transcription factor [Rarobacter incanus]